LDAETDSRGPALFCDMGGVTSPDLATVEALCRFRLALADQGYAVEIRNASPGLRELLLLCGLDRVLPLVHQGQPEEREQSVCVEEEIEPGDPAL
jgi:ABC-type transporter Mla MlaB component